jgi:hypothetical protein
MMGICCSKRKFEMSSFFAALMLISAAPSDMPVVPPTQELARPDVTKMKMSQIREFNAGLSKEHRYYIICRTDNITGSLAQRARTCRTREDWDAMARNAQRYLNEITDRGTQVPIPPPQ